MLYQFSLGFDYDLKNLTSPVRFVALILFIPKVPIFTHKISRHFLKELFGIIW